MKFQFYNYSIAEQAGLNLTLSETLKTGFLVLQPSYVILNMSYIAESITSVKITYKGTFS